MAHLFLNGGIFKWPTYFRTEVVYITYTYSMISSSKIWGEKFVTRVYLLFIISKTLVDLDSVNNWNSTSRLITLLLSTSFLPINIMFRHLNPVKMAHNKTKEKKKTFAGKRLRFLLWNYFSEGMIKETPAI